MADITKEQVVEFIGNMTVLELSEFIKELEDVFGVEAAAPAAAVVAAPAAGGEAAAEEKTEFDVVLKAPAATRLLSSRLSVPSPAWVSRKLRLSLTKLPRLSRKALPRKRLKKQPSSSKKLAPKLKSSNFNDLSYS